LKKIYFVRHCSAEGQHKDSPLTRAGIKQALELADFFNKHDMTFDLILSSPYLRAIDSIIPYAKSKGITIQIDERLRERLLSEEPVDDWMEALEKSFEDERFSLPGGESARDVIDRSNEVLTLILQNPEIRNALIVSHGNLLSHLFHQFNREFGFKQWKELRNPDVYLLEIDQDNHYKLECIWKID